MFPEPERGFQNRHMVVSVVYCDSVSCYRDRTTFTARYRLVVNVILHYMSDSDHGLDLKGFLIKGGSWDTDVGACVDFTMHINSVGIYSIYST